MGNKLAKFNKLKTAGVIVLLILLPFLVTNQYNLHMIVMAGIYAIMAIGLDLIIGYTGALSLAHAAFFGIGAYTSALLTLNTGVNFWVGLLAAIGATAFASLLVGLVCLRTRGIAFIIMTISFANITYLIALNWVSLTNGQMGLSLIPPPILGAFKFDAKFSYYYLVLALMLLVYYLARCLVNSRVGRAWIGIRENELLAESVGVDPFKYSLFAFVAGSSLAGLSGSLYAHYTTFISPENLMFSVTLILLVMTVLGGKGTLLGPVIGAAIFTVVPEYLRIAEDLRLPIFGLLLVVLALFMPKGLLPAFLNWYDARRGKGVEKHEAA
jgi:branched-chain amino acid transport system permease protein